MTQKPPAFQFFPRDWLTSRAVTVMTPTQRGYYINLLAHAWLADVTGTLPNDLDVLWQLAGARSRAEFVKCSALVLAQFRKNKGGKQLRSERLIQERQAQKRRNLEKRDAGRRGASARWNNKIDGSRMVLPLAENGSASAFAFASASAPANQELKPAQPQRAARPPIPEQEQRRRVEARDVRLEKEAEVRRELYVGAGPICEGPLPEIRKQIAEIARKKAL